MALVRCPKHGRVYDSDKDAGCPACLAESEMPRAPGPARKDSEPPKPPSNILGIFILLLFLGGAGYGGYYYYKLRNRPSEAAQEYARRRANAARVLGGAPVDESHFVDPSDLTPVRQARALKAALEGLLQGQRGALLGFREGPIDSAATDRAEKRRNKDYATFVGRWNARLDAATRNGTEFLYPPNTRMGPQMETVTNQMQAALSVMRDLVPADRVKPHDERQSDLTAAGGYLNAAGTVLTNLPK